MFLLNLASSECGTCTPCVAQVQGDVLESRELEFYRELARLRDSTSFSVTEFARCTCTCTYTCTWRFVDRIRESVSCHLHRLVVTEGGLAAELRTVWDIFLLGRSAGMVVIVLVLFGGCGLQCKLYTGCGCAHAVVVQGGAGPGVHHGGGAGAARAAGGRHAA